MPPPADTDPGTLRRLGREKVADEDVRKLARLRDAEDTPSPHPSREAPLLPPASDKKKSGLSGPGGLKR